MRRRRQDDDVAREVVELAALADGSLAPERRAALEERVAGSSELADLLAEQQRALELVSSVAAEVEAPAGLRARIEMPRRVRRTAMPRRRLGVLGAAATVAVAAVIGVSVFGSDDSQERFDVALAPTNLAQSASGTATLTKTSSGWRIELRATGLPRLDGGRFYEAWLRNAAGVLVPIGTFNEGPKVTLWAGVSPKDFMTLTVTREQADGEQASSGEKVLVGTVESG